ncbi:hypothetical protein SAMN05421595_1910 [Austwickia chelonae]|nr:hypothetical protein SAMN05421595_1910 [Austwickia chelonae]
MPILKSAQKGDNHAEGINRFDSGCEMPFSIKDGMAAADR